MAEAASVLKEALEIALPALGSDHQLIAIYKINLKPSRYGDLRLSSK